MDERDTIKLSGLEIIKVSRVLTLTASQGKPGDNPLGIPLNYPVGNPNGFPLGFLKYFRVDVFAASPGFSSNYLI